MRVLHVIPSVSPWHGGPSQAVLDMVRGLARTGLNVHLATTDDDGANRLVVPSRRPVVEDGVTIWYFPRQTRFYTTSWPLTAWLWRNVANYDLIHVHAVFRYPSVLAAFYACWTGVPYVLTLHGLLGAWGMRNRRPFAKRLSFWLIDRHAVRHAALIHYTSEQERLDGQALGVRVPAAVVPLGIDLSAFSRLPPAGSFRRQYPELAERMFILFLSRLDPIKGLDLLLTAFAQLLTARPNLALVIAGGGAPGYETQLRQQTRALGLEQDVIFTGFLRGERKLAALADCDVFVLPSYSESFGVVVVEAMACRKPVLITDQVAIHREVARAEAGIVVPNTVDALADGLGALLNDPAVRRKMGSNGHRLVVERFEISRTTEQLLNCYRALVRSSSVEPASGEGSFTNRS